MKNIILLNMGLVHEKSTMSVYKTTVTNTVMNLFCSCFDTKTEIM